MHFSSTLHENLDQHAVSDASVQISYRSHCDIRLSAGLLLPSRVNCEQDCPDLSDSSLLTVLYCQRHSLASGPNTNISFLTDNFKWMSMCVWSVHTQCLSLHQVHTCTCAVRWWTHIWSEKRCLCVREPGTVCVGLCRTQSVLVWGVVWISIWSLGCKPTLHMYQ